MSTLRKIAIGILSWNGRHHLELCLPAVLEQKTSGFEWEVVIYDNGSSDGTAEWVRETHPEVRLIESEINHGFCGGNNRLVRAVDADAVIFLNNDTRPEPGWLAALVDALAAAPADVAAVSGLIVDWDAERLDFARGIMTFDGHAFQEGTGRALGNVRLAPSGSELLFACGGNMIVRRESFLEAGGFDESYFAYLEDVDLGWRLWAGGERVIWTSEAVVRHRSMASSQLLGSFNRGFLFERNAFLTAHKNYESGLWQQIMPAVMLTLTHRTQTLLVQNNPGAEQLTWNPYEGMIADTASSSLDSREELLDPLPKISLREKWQGYGPRDFFRRGIRKAARLVLPAWVFDEQEGTRLTDGRTVAQFRAVSHLLGNLEGAEAARRRTQARRCRPDREIFERFPLYLVPTYPGDSKLFASSAFSRWLPEDLPLVRRDLDEIMEDR